MTFRMIPPRLDCAVRLACLMEATARKPGNVHPRASFADLTYGDFVRSAEAVAEPLSHARETGVGAAVLESISRTRAVVGRNTNLGIVLLLAPLAAADTRGGGRPLGEAVREVLTGLTREDASLVYRAIRLAQPGGMGEVGEEDLSREPAGTLVEVMRLAAGRDTIAKQYATGFDLVLNFGVPVLEAGGDFAADWETVVIGLHLRLMAREPDTLIARKCGRGVAEESARRARGVLDAGWPGAAEGRRKVAELDGWLRGDGNRRNPGTTADLVTACLFAALREGRIEAPPLERSEPAAV